MTPTRRHVGMVATLRELESSLTDAALTMFGQLVGRANLRARKRLEETVAASLSTARGSSHGDPKLFAGDRLRFPKDPQADLTEGDAAKQLAMRAYGALPTMRITDVLSQVARWTGFVGHFSHLTSGLPPEEERAFLAALIAESTNLGLSRMAESAAPPPGG